MTVTRGSRCAQTREDTGTRKARYRGCRGQPLSRGCRGQPHSRGCRGQPLSSGCRATRVCHPAGVLARTLSVLAHTRALTLRVAHNIYYM